LHVISSKLQKTNINVNNIECYFVEFVYIVGSANYGNNRATCVTLWENVTHAACATLWKNVSWSDAQECNVRLWPTSRDRVSTNQRSSS